MPRKKQQTASSRSQGSSSVKKKTKAPRKKTTKKTTRKKPLSSATSKKKTIAKKTKTKKRSTKPTKKTLKKNSRTPKQQASRSRIAKPTVLHLTHSNIHEQEIELQLFEFDALEHFNPEQEIIPPELVTATPQPPEKQSTPVAVAVVNLFTDKNSPHILDLTQPIVKKTTGITEIEWEGSDLEILKTLELAWQGERVTQAPLSKSKQQLLEEVLNLSVVSWLLYTYLFLYTITAPILYTAHRVGLFLTKALFGYIQILGQLTSIGWQALLGKTRLNRDSILYPERALVDLRLFEHKKEPIMRFAFQPIAIKSLLLFVVFSMAVVAPIKGLALYDSFNGEKERVLGVSETAYSSLQQALADIEQFSWLQASEHFSESKGTFSIISSEFAKSKNGIVTVLQVLPTIGDKIQSAESLVQLGVDISILGEHLTQLVYQLQTADTSVTITQKINTVRQTITNITKLRNNIEQNLDAVTVDVLPENIQSEVLLLQETLPKVFAHVDQMKEVLDVLYTVLGGDKQQRYVVIFQNSDELRATGGFMGSLSTITLYQGKILNTETPGGGPYDWQGWLTTIMKAPQPLWLVNPNWQFQDANWFVNFPTTAHNVLRFYHQIKPQKVDGVIAVNSHVLPEILRITGDIDMPEYERYLTPENVITELQEAVELDYDTEENKPKKIIGDLLLVISERLLDLEHKDMIAVLEIVNTSMMQRDIQLYLVDDSLQKKIEQWKWGGSIVQTQGDYFALYNHNIGGAKTDKFVEQTVDIQSTITASGEIINTARITRTNNGIAGDVFYGHNNVNYFRIVVPENSILLSAEGDFEPPNDALFELPNDEAIDDVLLHNIEQNPSFDPTSGLRITSEYNKTVFGGWLQTNVGETSEITITYKLPFTTKEIENKTNNIFVEKFNTILSSLGIKTDSATKHWHTMYWQQQSGTRNQTNTYHLTYPYEWKLDYSARPGFANNNSIQFQSTATIDTSNGFLFSE